MYLYGGSWGWATLSEYWFEKIFGLFWLRIMTPKFPGDLIASPGTLILISVYPTTVVSATEIKIKVPGDLIASPGTLILISVALTTVVGYTLPLMEPCASCGIFSPKTVSVKSPVRAITPPGLTEKMLIGNGVGVGVGGRRGGGGGGVGVG